MGVYSWIKEKTKSVTISSYNNTISDISKQEQCGITKVTYSCPEYWEADLYRPGEKIPFMHVRVHSLDHLFSRYSKNNQLEGRVCSS